jgi:hypothetical protein
MHTWRDLLMKRITPPLKAMCAVKLSASLNSCAVLSKSKITSPKRDPNMYWVMCWLRVPDLCPKWTLDSNSCLTVKSLWTPKKSGCLKGFSISILFSVNTFSSLNCVNDCDLWLPLDIWRILWTLFNAIQY